MNYYDIHLSASAISPAAIEAIEKLGMTKDGLRNNRNSVEPHHHASAPHLEGADEELWVAVKNILRADPGFRGALEFEFNDVNLRQFFKTSPTVTPMKTAPFRLSQCRPGEHKACDLHIRVNPLETSVEALNELDKFNFIFFERLVGEVWHPVYTLTFEDTSIGKAVMERLATHLGSIPGLVAKMKLEIIHDHWVHPADATQLPIVRTKDAEVWLRHMD